MYNDDSNFNNMSYRYGLKIYLKLMEMPVYFGLSLGNPLKIEMPVVILEQKDAVLVGASILLFLKPDVADQHCYYPDHHFCWRQVTEVVVEASLTLGTRRVADPAFSPAELPSRRAFKNVFFDQ